MTNEEVVVVLYDVEEKKMQLTLSFTKELLLVPTKKNLTITDAGESFPFVIYVDGLFLFDELASLVAVLAT